MLCSKLSHRFHVLSWKDESYSGYRIIHVILPLNGFTCALTLPPVQLYWRSAESVPSSPCVPRHWKKLSPSQEKPRILSSCPFGSFQTTSCALCCPPGLPAHTPASRCISLSPARFNFHFEEVPSEDSASKAGSDSSGCKHNCINASEAAVVQAIAVLQKVKNYSEGD